jgi:3-oxoacyl-[acyl-carrier-protein] synthase II
LGGQSGIRRIEAFDPSGYAVTIAGQVPPEFQELDYISAKERQHVSRVTPLALAAAEEAIADAGLAPERMSMAEKRGVAVIVGSGGGSQEFTEEQYRLYYTGQSKLCSVYVIPTSTIGTLASEVSMRFGFRGFSHIVSTGCTSSTDAIGYALRQIQHGYAETVVCGGADAPIAPLILRGFILMRILSQKWNHAPAQASRPFSRDRDGFVLGEGSWFFVMESEDRARSRGARIYGEVAGHGSTCEAYHRVRLEECGEEPARAMTMAMQDADAPPEAIGYVAYHGTSTDLNDRIETRAMHLAFGDLAPRIPGSSIKSIIGHPQGACGAAGMAATLLAMRDGMAPPTVNLTDPAPECDLDYIPNTARPLPIEWAVCNTIAFGSKNSALVLRRAR